MSARVSSVTHTSQSLHAHYLTKNKTNKQKQTHSKSCRARFDRQRGETMIFDNNANPPTILKIQYFFERECETLHATHIHTNKQPHYTENGKVSEELTA